MLACTETTWRAASCAAISASFSATVCSSSHTPEVLSAKYSENLWQCINSQTNCLAQCKCSAWVNHILSLLARVLGEWAQYTGIFLCISSSNASSSHISLNFHMPWSRLVAHRRKESDWSDLQAGGTSNMDSSTTIIQSETRNALILHLHYSSSDKEGKAFQSEPPMLWEPQEESNFPCIWTFDPQHQDIQLSQDINSVVT